jgi:hypothetical protein
MLRMTIIYHVTSGIETAISISSQNPMRDEFRREQLGQYHALRSLMLARISVIISAFGFAPCGPP